jgi:gliding motility-associated-like protein
VTINASSTNICSGDPVTFTALPTNGGNTPSYQWVVNGNDSGSYSPTFTSNSLNNGDSVYCIMTSSVANTSPVPSAALYMVVNPSPTVAFSPDTFFITADKAAKLTPLVTGNISQYQWSPPEGLNNTDTAAPFANPSKNTIYQLTVTTDKGCASAGTVAVIFAQPLEMPGAFTPNHDGKNDRFRILPGAQLVLQEFDVFDRWGHLVFFTHDISKGWDGSYNGAIASAGTYIYIVRGKTPVGKPVVLKGTVVLIR